MFYQQLTGQLRQGEKIFVLPPDLQYSYLPMGALTTGTEVHSDARGQRALINTAAPATCLLPHQHKPKPHLGVLQGRQQQSSSLNAGQYPLKAWRGRQTVVPSNPLDCTLGLAQPQQQPRLPQLSQPQPPPALPRPQPKALCETLHLWPDGPPIRLPGLLRSDQDRTLRTHINMGQPGHQLLQPDTSAVQGQSQLGVSIEPGQVPRTQSALHRPIALRADLQLGRWTAHRGPQPPAYLPFLLGTHGDQQQGAQQSTSSPEPQPPGISESAADSDKDQIVQVEDRPVGIPELHMGQDDAAESRRLDRDAPPGTVEAIAGATATRASPSPAQPDSPAASRLATSDREAPAGAPNAAVAQASQLPAPTDDASGHAAEPGQQPREHSGGAQPPAGEDRAAAAACPATRRPVKRKAREWTGADSSDESEGMKGQLGVNICQQLKSSAPPGRAVRDRKQTWKAREMALATRAASQLRAEEPTESTPDSKVSTKLRSPRKVPQRRRGAGIRTEGNLWPAPKLLGSSSDPEVDMELEFLRKLAQRRRKVVPEINGGLGAVFKRKRSTQAGRMPVTCSRTAGATDVPRNRKRRREAERSPSPADSDDWQPPSQGERSGPVAEPPNSHQLRRRRRAQPQLEPSSSPGSHCASPGPKRAAEDQPATLEVPQEAGEAAAGRGSPDAERPRRLKRRRLRSARSAPPGGHARRVVPCSEDGHWDTRLPRVLALDRPKRVPGGNPLDRAPFRRFMEMIRGNSSEFEAGGRVLRLKQYMAADANCAMMEEVIAALSANTRVGALYIQNFEWGMYDRQLELLTEVLKKKHIWALNIGENFNITMDGWQTFTDALCDTAVSYMYVSEHHLMRTDLKTQMRDAIRKNRERLPLQDPEVCARIRNMWWCPKVINPVKTPAVLPEAALLGPEHANNQ